jgi:hypothetical protein
MIMARLRVVELPGADGRYLLLIDKVDRLSPLHDLEVQRSRWTGLAGCAGAIVFGEEVVEVK